MLMVRKKLNPKNSADQKVVGKMPPVFPSLPSQPSQPGITKSDKDNNTQLCLTSFGVRVGYIWNPIAGVFLVRTGYITNPLAGVFMVRAGYIMNPISGVILVRAGV